MALASPCLQKDWNEWWNKIGGPRRIPWRERMMRWIRVEVREGEEACVEEHQEEVSEEEEEVKARVETEEEDGGSSEGEGEEEEELLTAEGKMEGLGVEAKEEEEGEDDGTKEEERVGKDEGGMEEEEGDEEEEVTKAENEEEELEVREEEETKEEGRVQKDEGGRAEEEGDEERKGENEEELDESEEVEGGEEEERKLEVETKVPAREEEEEEELEEPSDETKGSDENLRHEDEEDEASESVESSEEDEDATGPTGPSLERLGSVYDEDVKDPDEKSSWGSSASFSGDSGAERQARTVSGSWTTEEDDFQDIDLDEEDSSGDEEAGEPMSEDEDGEEEEVKVYSKGDYASEVFRRLGEFRASSLFTDLALTAADGRTLHVHSLVLAAVSSLVWRETLGRNRARRKDRQGVPARTPGWSLSLGPEVDPAGLEAVVEFAYTGSVAGLSRGGAGRVRAAALALGAPRVEELCGKVERQRRRREEEEEEEEATRAAQQMAVSLQLIRQLWADGVGCDVALEALGESLYAHRVMLAASSDYFRSMFTLGMKESRQHSVTLPFLPACELEALVGCSYSGALPLGWGRVFELTGTALRLQHHPALWLCLGFLRQELSPETCLDVASFAEAYELPQVLEVADDFILRQFQKVASTSKFRDLPARQLLRYLNSRSLCVSSELIVFKAVVSWIQARPRTRLRLSRALMKTIHFPLMTFKEFKEVRADNMWSDHRLEALYEAIFEDFCTDETTFHNRCRVYLPKESLVLVGGEQTSDDLGTRRISRELWFGNSLRNLTGIRKAMEWRKLGDMPEPARFCHEVAVLRGQLYVFGGKKYYGDGDILNSVARFDPLRNSWESLADMLERRSSFSVVVQDGKIYAMGGHSTSAFRDSVERYCPATNSWSFAWPLDLPLSGHVAKVHQGRVFVSGGRNDDYPCVASMFLYHPETGSSYLASMAAPRAHHCMEVLGERLYVAGGVCADEQLNAVDQLSCEVYHPASDAWTALAAFPVPHVGAASAVLEGKLYVLGGYSQEDYSDTNMVHRYDPATQRWENMGKMPGPNNDIRACVLGLPQHFRS